MEGGCIREGQVTQVLRAVDPTSCPILFSIALPPAFFCPRCGSVAPQVDATTAQHSAGDTPFPGSRNHLSKLPKRPRANFARLACVRTGERNILSPPHARPRSLHRVRHVNMLCRPASNQRGSSLLSYCSSAHVQPSPGYNMTRRWATRVWHRKAHKSRSRRRSCCSSIYWISV